jgi:hypothetical protein
MPCEMSSAEAQSHFSFFLSFFSMELGFDLRTQHLRSRRSATSATPLVHFALFFFFEDGGFNKLFHQDGLSCQSSFWQYWGLTSESTP